MKTIGLIGGMSWESSLQYYRLINEMVKQRLGGFHSAKIVMLSVDFAEVEELQHEGRWVEAGKMMAESALALQNAGADCVVLCTNTMHKCAVDIEASIKIPFLHIADSTAEKICSEGIKTIGLLGTRFTMEQDFYRGRLKDKFGLNVLVPSESDREIIHRVIYDELVLGKINAASRVEYQRVINELVLAGAEGIILGCTEIGLLISQKDVGVPIFDTTLFHAQAAVDFAIKSERKN
jgi:aspartate racemase